MQFCFIIFADSISESNPRVIDDTRARKCATDLKRCSYYETCATYGLNVERVFQDGMFLMYTPTVPNWLHCQDTRFWELVKTSPFPIMKQILLDRALINLVTIVTF